MTIEEIKAGQGGVVEVDGKKVAVYVADNGEKTKLSPVCKHLACIVGWNSQEGTWDCPCHGSRYKADGTVIHGPALKNLDKVD